MTVLSLICSSRCVYSCLRHCLRYETYCSYAPATLETRCSQDKDGSLHLTISDLRPGKEYLIQIRTIFADEIRQKLISDPKSTLAITKLDSPRYKSFDDGMLEFYAPRANDCSIEFSLLEETSNFDDPDKMDFVSIEVVTYKSSTERQSESVASVRFESKMASKKTYMIGYRVTKNFYGFLPGEVDTVGRFEEVHSKSLSSIFMTGLNSF